LDLDSSKLPGLDWIRQAQKVVPTFPFVLIHPDDLLDLSLSDDQKVRMTSKCGSVVVHSKAFDGVQKGVVIMESIWPNSAFEEGVGVNALVSAEPGYPNGGGVFHDTAVTLAGV